MNAHAAAASAAQERGLSLRRNAFMHLRDPQGWHIECLSGNAWITQEGDLQDTLLGPGQSHVVRHPARLLLQALDDCALRIRPDPDRAPTRLVSHA